ncbi:MAG: serine/threonine protein kinase [Actinobacteria bacterium]|nr:serine/threonine protein kinase [Actinomycetota bacterium]
MTHVLGGRYRLDEPIGGGGAASVWRGRDLTLDRDVAIKRLHARLRDDSQYAERFAREAQVVSRFNHPSVVTLVDRGEDDGEPFMVFELIDGEDLKARILRSGPLAPAHAAVVCAQIADALAYAHERGVVHRDVKSQNVMLTRDGAAKLTDFGIAYFLDMEGRSELTRTGTLVGTSDYLAPEQATGRAVDGRTDIYSLGVVLYECLTGQLPFRADNALALALRHVNEPVPDPRSVRPDIPSDIAVATLRATAKRPTARFPDAATMARALRDGPGDTAELGLARPDSQPLARVIDATPEHDTGAMPVVAQRRGRWRPSLLPSILTTFALVGAGALAWLVLGGRGGGPRDAAFPIAGARSEDPFGDGRENDAQARLAIDGNVDTSWPTERYQSADIRALKGGVGIRVVLRDPAAATSMVLTTRTVGARFTVLAGAPSRSSSRAEIGSGTTVAGSVRVPLRPGRPTKEYVVWFTALPRSVDGDGFRGSIAEVELLGVSKTNGT